MRLLLIVAAVIEAGCGLLLLLLTARTVTTLLGGVLVNPSSLVAGRIAGAALVALAITSWQVRRADTGNPRLGLVQATLFYCFAAAAVFVHAGIRMELRGEWLWPLIVLHLSLGAWCLLTIWFSRRKSSKAESTSEEESAEQPAE